MTRFAEFNDDLPGLGPPVAHVVCTACGCIIDGRFTEAHKQYCHAPVWGWELNSDQPIDPPPTVDWIRIPKDSGNDST